MKRLLLLSVCMVAGGLAVRAADVGDPIFPVDMNDKARAELIYEHLRHDMDNKGPGDAVQKLNADTYTARLHTDVGKQAYLDFDLGGMNPSGGDFGFYGGVGLRMLMLDEPSWRMSGVLQGHYAPSLSGKVGGTKNAGYHLWDADAALLLSGKLPIDQQMIIVPYAGPAMSLIRLDGHDSADHSIKVSEDEKSPIGAVVGVALRLPANNSFRIEGRYFGGSFERDVFLDIS